MEHKWKKAQRSAGAEIQRIISNKAGMSMLELVIGTAINTLLSIGIISIFINILNDFSVAMNNWELLDEVNQAATQIRDSVRYADHVTVENNTITVYEKNIGTNSDNVVVYNLSKNLRDRCLYRNGQPITGGSKMGTVFISKFNAEQKEEYIIHMLIEGTNNSNGQTFSLETDMLCYAAYMADKH